MSATAPLLFKPHTKDLGDFAVRRLLPAFPAKMIGPFIFFDHMGPADFPPGRGIDVRPHPHIGLATVTYLFEGRILHRDSLGSVQSIAPGDVNWMTAGAGIVHSERSSPEDRKAPQRLHGIQAWIALPRAHETTAPSFVHLPKEALPLIQRPGVAMRLIAGTAYGQRAPTPTYSEMFYLAVELEAGASIDLPGEHAQRGIYAVEGDISIDGEPLAPFHMAMFAGTDTIQIRAASASRVMLLGGAPMDGERLIWWNLVASSQDMIDAAKQRWREQRFPPVPDETEFIPLPDH
ncbi:MAG: pirin [Betaproteobacteria bacterium]|nr:pirin [Betaproteobacteria bacterium]